jgi:hypothetical protein
MPVNAYGQYVPYFTPPLATPGIAPPNTGASPTQGAKGTPSPGSTHSTEKPSVTVQIKQPDSQQPQQQPVNVQTSPGQSGPQIPPFNPSLPQPNYGSPVSAPPRPMNLTPNPNLPARNFGVPTPAPIAPPGARAIVPPNAPASAPAGASTRAPAAPLTTDQRVNNAEAQAEKATQRLNALNPSTQIPPYKPPNKWEMYGLALLGLLGGGGPIGAFASGMEKGLVAGAEQNYQRGLQLFDTREGTAKDQATASITYADALNNAAVRSDADKARIAYENARLEQQQQDFLTTTQFKNVALKQAYTLGMDKIRAFLVGKQISEYDAQQMTQALIQRTILTQAGENGRLGKTQLYQANVLMPLRNIGAQLDAQLRGNATLAAAQGWTPAQLRAANATSIQDANNATSKLYSIASAMDPTLPPPTIGAPNIDPYGNTLTQTPELGIPGNIGAYSTPRTPSALDLFNQYRGIYEEGKQDANSNGQIVPDDNGQASTGVQEVKGTLGADPILNRTTGGGAQVPINVAQVLRAPTKDRAVVIEQGFAQSGVTAPGASDPKQLASARAGLEHMINSGTPQAVAPDGTLPTFFSKLHEAYPNISGHDLRLLAATWIAGTAAIAQNQMTGKNSNTSTSQTTTHTAHSTNSADTYAIPSDKEAAYQAIRDIRYNQLAAQFGDDAKFIAQESDTYARKTLGLPVPPTPIERMWDAVEGGIKNIEHAFTPPSVEQQYESLRKSGLSEQQIKTIMLQNGVTEQQFNETVKPTHQPAAQHAAPQANAPHAAEEVGDKGPIVGAALPIEQVAKFIESKFFPAANTQVNGTPAPTNTQKSDPTIAQMMRMPLHNTIQYVAKKTPGLGEMGAPLLAAILTVESSGNPNVISPAGAIGYMQLTPATARMLGVDPNNPVENIMGGAKYIALLLKKFHSIPLALAGYNAGPNAVDQYHGIPPYPETRAYVQKVLGVYRKLLGTASAQ